MKIMDRIMERIKERYKHRSLFSMTIPELEAFKKKQIENGWIYAVNAIIAVLFGQCFFWYEYQHMAIIITIAGLFVFIGSLSISSYVEQIDQAMFMLKESERRSKLW